MKRWIPPLPSFPHSSTETVSRDANPKLELPARRNDDLAPRRGPVVK